MLYTFISQMAAVLPHTAKQSALAGRDAFTKFLDIRLAGTISSQIIGVGK
jgi:hypothetical protein